MVSFLPSKRPDIAIDFGTANLRIIRREGGVVFDEPSLCCFADARTLPMLVAAGAGAHAMVDRTPGHLEVRRPLRRGVLQDIDTATELLRYAVPRALGRKRPRAPAAVIGVPADATQAERSALLTAARDAGLGPVQLVPEPLAAAMGAGLPVDEAGGTMIVECGAGTTEVAVLSLGGICLTRSVRAGGAALDQAIADHLHLRHQFLIGERTAEQTKQAYVEQHGAGVRPATIEVRGRNLASGLPGLLSLPLDEIDRVVEKHVGHIVEVIRDVLSQTPPELSHDICDRGIVLTGGGAMTPLLREMIGEETGLPVTLASDPAYCVANGLHHILLN